MNYDDDGHESGIPRPRGAVYQPRRRPPWNPLDLGDFFWRGPFARRLPPSDPTIPPKFDFKV